MSAERWPVDELCQAHHAEWHRRTATDGAALAVIERRAHALLQEDEFITMAVLDGGGEALSIADYLASIHRQIDDLTLTTSTEAAQLRRRLARLDGLSLYRGRIQGFHA
jgi:hypothetical protein